MEAIDWNSVGKAEKIVCSRCKRPPQQQYFLLANKPYCADCKGWLDPQDVEPLTLLIVLRTLRTVVVLVGGFAFLNSIVDHLMGQFLGLPWLFFGGLLGFNIRVQSRRQPHWGWGLLSLLALYLSIGLSLAITLVWGLAPGQQWDVTTVVRHVILPGPLLLVQQEPWVFGVYGYGLYRAWKGTRSKFLAFDGPMQIGRGDDDMILCANCFTVLGPSLQCLSCGVLVHRKQLATLEQEAVSVSPSEQISLWQKALTLVPLSSEQAASIKQRLRVAQNAQRSFERSGTRSIFSDFVLSFAKLPTLLSMLVSIVFYGQMWGWPFATGFVLCIYLHEIGHVLELRRLKMQFESPLFVPGLGAYVPLKEKWNDPTEDAHVGLSGPVFGLMSVLICAGLFAWTNDPLFFVLRRAAAVLNLVNLIPLWPLDGGRGFRPLSRIQRAVVVLACLVLWFCTRDLLFVAISAVAAFQVWRCPPLPEAGGSRSVLAVYLVLVTSLGWFV